MTRFKSHGRIYSVFLLLILVLAILLLTGCNQQTAYDISEDLPASDFTDAQLEFFQDNIGRTEQDKQIVLYRNIEDSGKWAYVYTWSDDGPTYVRYLFCDDNDEYQNRYEEIRMNLYPCETYDDSLVIQQDMTSAYEVQDFFYEIGAENWQDLYDYITQSDAFSDYTLLT